MFDSLRFGMLLAMLTVAAIAIVTITLFAGVTARIEFSRYVAYAGAVQDERVQEAVLQFWDTQSDEKDASGRPVAAMLTDGMEMIVVNPEFVRVYPPERIRMVSGNIENLRFLTAPDGTVHVKEGDQTIGVLNINPADELALIPAQIEFVQSINGSLLLAAAAGAMAAVFLTIILSRRILLPIAALTSAAHKLENGDLNQRVITSAQGEIGTLAHAFNAMAETLNRNENLRRSMVSDIAHELRTPVTNIRGYLEALQDGLLTADTATIDLLYEEALLLNHIVQDLQELALAEAGQLYYDKQPIKLEEVIRQTVTMLQPTAAQKKITLQTQYPPDLPYVYADNKRIGQVLRNLLNNAVTHTPENGHIKITTHVLPAMLEVRVYDNGIGISAEHLPYVFERFYRVDPSRSRHTGGAGLGLAIVRQLIEAHQGTVRVESTLGEGTCFTFTLPLAHDAP